MAEGRDRPKGEDGRDGDRFRALSTSAFDMISEVDARGRVTYVSPNHAALHERDPLQMAGSLGFDKVLPEDQPMVAEQFAHLFSRGECARATFRVLDDYGEIRWIECTGTTIDSDEGERRALLLSREVTDQKRTEESLRASRERFQSIAENAYDMIAEMDEDGRVLFANDRVTLGLEISSEGGWREDPGLLLHPDDLPRVAEAYAEATRGGSPSPIRYRVQHGDRSWRWIEARYRRYLNSEGAARIVAIARDLTESIEAERERAESEERYRNLVEGSPLGIVVAQEGAIVFTNLAGLEVCGARTREELLGHPMLDLLVPEDAATVAGQIAQIERGEHLPDVVEVRIRGLDGKIREVVAAGSIIRFEGAPAYQGIVRDMTGLRSLEREQKRLELQLQEARKLESLGMLAGGVAHDFNNLLAVILANTRFALRRAGDDELTEALSDAIDAGDQAARLTSQLLAYAGRRSPEVRSADFSETVRSTSGLLRSAVPADIELSFALASDLPTVRVDTVQLEQVLMNLVMNAADAIGDAGGKVRVATGSRYIGAEETSAWVEDSRRPEGRYVYLEVEDSGSGMDEETRERIFEPFFTTKDLGHGLGLAAVIGMVRGHGGGVDIHTAPGEGTRFRVYLPEERDEPSPREDIGGVALLVVPEDALRLKISKALAARGVVTLVAARLEDALDLMRRHGAEIDAAICDLDDTATAGTMLDALRAEKPALPLLLTGAGASEELQRRLLNQGPAEMTAGPWRVAELVEQLASLLGKA